MFGNLYRTKEPGKLDLPSVYTMNYRGEGPVSEALIIENARKMLEFVASRHSEKPHVYGFSLGCAVAVAVIAEHGLEAKSLTLCDPFTSFPDVVPTVVGRCGGIVTLLPCLLGGVVFQKAFQMCGL